MYFRPLETLVGGYLLHLSTSAVLSDSGRVFGISGIVDGAIFGDKHYWRWASIAGLVLGPTLAAMLGIGGGGSLDGWEDMSLVRVLTAGFFVGFGSRLGSGCTSGHFLCGVSRLSPRSIIATATFFTTALVTANTLPSALPSMNNGSFHPELPSYRYSCLLLSILPMIQIIRLRINRYLLATQPSTTVVRALPYFFAALAFSLGLIISDMANPQTVLAFLRPFSESFNPSLVLIVISGVIPNGIYWARTPKGKAALPWESWRIPSRTDVDWRLLIGAAIFGVGWGMAGVCPGPALVGLGSVIRFEVISPGLSQSTITVYRYVGAMIAGMSAAHLVI